MGTDLKKVIVYKTRSQADVDYYGFLHGFSVESEVDDNGPVHCPVGIVERAFTGQLDSVYVSFIRIENRSDEQLFDDGDLDNWCEVEFG